ncbi:generating NADPH oxidase heavy chain subunit [Seminavis robusta]|uniref:Generating NADPH oxidase heavy chain subunit n=1 Tax=Seminavis robusta TaxID=568900 RepID=A0A9N8E1F1_9STRA|nr:generating NADPH oxidase heavy chain subunit [Seminavis robusta]|eukprot:Sro552_g165120.1 generating NADPH oxidase heavy chain subunit (749) ;mRNA; f:39657-41903
MDDSRTRSDDTGMEQSSKGKRISGSGHFAMQVMQSSSLHSNLPRIMEDKSKHFDLYEPVEPEEIDYARNGDDKPVCDANRIFRMGGEVPYTKRQHGTSKGGTKPGVKSVDFYEAASVSTMGNGTHFDKEVPSHHNGNGNGKKGVSFQDDVMQDQPWVIRQCPNEPHPLLEFPPLYWLVHSSPGLLEAIKHLYSFRWRMSYPLQRRVFLSQQLRKAGIFCTIGELLLVIPLVGIFLGGLLSAFVWPSTYWSGHIARLPLILALATAMRNSLITLLIGLPFERALWYHKVLGRLAFFNGILHTIVAHADALEKTFHKFLVYDQMNSSGTGLFLLIAGVTITSLPQVRHWCFELFYYIHVIFVVLMTACAFYHSGVLIPILASIIWGGDLLCRKIVMAGFRYPRNARLRVISDTVVELSFPKTAAFDYNAGQHLSIAVPEIVGAGLEFHPFSIATCPRQPNVSIMIRVAGDWTKALHKLAKEKNEVSILVEGPNGSPNIDIFSDRYKSFLLFSGGIGITPIQSMCNQLVYEQNKGRRELEKVRMVWSDRDPCCVEKTDVVRRASTSQHFQAPDLDLEDLDLRSIASHSVFNDGKSQTTDIASVLLSMVPPSRRTDAELEVDYPVPDFGVSRKKSNRKASAAPTRKKNKASDESTFRGAYNNADLSDILDIQVYLTKGQAPTTLANMPFVHTGRPDVEQIFADMRDEALESGLNRVAVIVCAPARLAHVLQVACVKYSDAELSFDFHMEYQD